MQGVIELNNMVFHACHGVFPQERIIGGTYTVSLKLKADFSRACQTDDLNDTINYGTVCQTVNDVMAEPSNLIEHVAARIVQRLLSIFPMLEEVTVRLCKKNPPISGMEIEDACFEGCFGRADF